ncbi:hypothetical protein ACRAKI_25645 [Saccharothrix isguenensis]
MAVRDGDSGLERFTSGEELERRYREEFRRLRHLDTLRSASLRVDGTTVHRRPPAAGPTQPARGGDQGRM